MHYIFVILYSLEIAFFKFSNSCIYVYMMQRDIILEKARKPIKHYIKLIIFFSNYNLVFYDIEYRYLGH